MTLSSMTLRRLGVAAIASLAVGAIALPGAAQTARQQMADKIATDAANQFVTKINGESCSQFAATMAQMKSGSGSSSGSASSSGGMASKLRANPQARTDFVNIVAAPLLNKMINCNMMPGGM